MEYASSLKIRIAGKEKWSNKPWIMLLKEVKVFNDEDGGIDVVLEFNGDYQCWKSISNKGTTEATTGIELDLDYFEPEYLYNYLNMD